MTEVKPDGKLHLDGYFTWARRDGYVLDAKLPAEFALIENVRAALDAVRAEERERWTEAVMAELDGNGQAQAIVAYAIRATPSGAPPPCCLCAEYAAVQAQGLGAFFRDLGSPDFLVEVCMLIYSHKTD